MHPRDRFWRVVVPVGVTCVVGTMLVVGWAAQPQRFVRGYAPTQPIPFSHKVHSGANRIPCEYCHTNAERSRDATIPAVQTCMNCHRAITMPDSAYIDHDVIPRLASDTALAWKRIYDLPDHVYFDHRAHVNIGVQCQTCHGEVQTMDVVSRVMNTRMGECLICHRNPKPYLPPGSTVTQGPTECTACHR